jgi:thiosulfate dehydrogenase
MKHIFPAILFTIVVVVVAYQLGESWLREKEKPVRLVEKPGWQAPSLYLDNVLEGKEREEVIYGEELIAHTSKYLGPKGSVASFSNGMNCQNCHLDAGTRSWGNNYATVVSTYPKFRDRSGTLETIPKRVNDCFERSLNGTAIDTAGKEMKAIVAYIKWVGQDVKKGTKPDGAGIRELTYLNRAADPVRGNILYKASCQSCHGSSGEGLLSPEGNEYAYPPLWGANSYNTGAGLYRLSRFAGYIKDNMPFNQTTHQFPALSDEDAWDLAAYVNSQPRPVKDIRTDWPDISKKPIDHPFGPFVDSFSEKQHKYGPFEPILAARKAAATKKN